MSHERNPKYTAGGRKFWAAATVLGLAGLAIAAPPAKPADVFQNARIWTVHLKFTADQWNAIEPKGGGGFPGGPGGPIRPGGPGGFGPAMFVTPAFMKGDANKDGKLSAEEFTGLGNAWFTAWDKQKTGKLTAEDLRAGLNTLAPMPGPGGPGGFGGPGGEGPGMAPRNGTSKRNGISAMSGINFEYVHADLDFDGTRFRDVAVRYKGNNSYMESRNSIKKSLKLDLNKYVKGQKLAGLTKINLHNNVTDASWMNEPLSYRLFRDAGVPSPRTSYARVFVTVPGKYDRKYFGLYSVVEDIDKHFAEERFGTREGAIFKPVGQNLFTDMGDDWSKYERMYDPKDDLTDAQKKRVIEFARFVSSADDAAFASGLKNYLDLDEFARFMAATVWLSNMDSLLSMGQNYYVYLHPQSNKFLFLPWDLDHSFGQFPMGGSTELSIQRPWQGQNRFLERVFQVDEFKKLYLARLAEINRTVGEPGRISKQVDETAALIRPAVKEESDEKLARFEKAVSGQQVEPAGFPGGGMGPGGPGEGPGGRMGPRMGGMKPIKGFVGPRSQSVTAQLAGKSQGQTGNGNGPGGRGGFGGPGGPGGPGGMGPGMFLAPAFQQAMGATQNAPITREQFARGFAKWFESWGGTKTGYLTEEQVRSGINRDLAPRGMPGGFGPPGGGRPPMQQE